MCYTPHNKDLVSQGPSNCKQVKRNSNWLKQKKKLLVLVTNKSRMARTTSTEVGPPPDSACLCVGCSFRNVLAHEVTRLPAAPGHSQPVHHLRCTWLALPESQPHGQRQSGKASCARPRRSRAAASWRPAHVCNLGQAGKGQPCAAPARTNGSSKARHSRNELLPPPPQSLISNHSDLAFTEPRHHDHGGL